MTLENAFTYLTTGEIESVSPTEGQVGTIVYIGGTLLLGGGSRLTEVSICGTKAEVISANDTVVAVELRKGPAVTCDVKLTSNTGASIVSANSFTTVASGEINSIRPTKGQ